MSSVIEDVLTDRGDRLLVACLCAGWCHNCDDYRPTFEALAAEFKPVAQFLWVDIEEQAELIGDVEVDNFPTLLIASGGALRFFGSVTPHAETVRQLLRRAQGAALTPVDDPLLAGLPQRLRSLA